MKKIRSKRIQLGGRQDSGWQEQVLVWKTYPKTVE